MSSGEGAAHVASYVEKFAAERAVERIKGVRAIAEKIEVRYPGHKKTVDDEIAERAPPVLAGTYKYRRIRLR